MRSHAGALRRHPATPIVVRVAFCILRGTHLVEPLQHDRKVLAMPHPKPIHRAKVRHRPVARQMAKRHVAPAAARQLAARSSP